MRTITVSENSFLSFPWGGLEGFRVERNPSAWIHGAGQGLRRTAGDQSAPRVSAVLRFAARSPERLPD